MAMIEVLPDMIIQSAAGHDQGGYFLVTAVDGQYALICDGKTRPLEKPKRKKFKHLHLVGVVSADILQALENKTLTNRMLRKEINKYRKL